MKFMIIRKADAATEAGEMPSDELLTAMGRYNEMLANAGVIRDGTGLRPSSDGARIRFSNGKPVVSDGPFTETRELIAGFTMIEVNSKQEAIDWAKQWPAMDADGNVELELRQLFEMEDFVPGEGIEVHRDLEKRMARQPSLMCMYIGFNGNCAQALHFYADCLGGHIEMAMTWGEGPADMEIPEEWKEKIMHAQLRAGRWTLMACDSPPEHYQPLQGCHLQITIDDQAAAEQVFNRLAEKGTVSMPFAETFWANRFGMLVDRFGVSWAINSGMK